MNSHAQRAFQAALLQIARSCSAAELAQSDEAYREAFLSFGSETEDNLAAAKVVSVGEFDQECEGNYGGLLVSEIGLPASALLHYAEGSEIPAAVRSNLPEVKQSHWDAVLRVATMTLLAFESCKSSERSQSILKS